MLHPARTMIEKLFAVDSMAQRLASDPELRLRPTCGETFLRSLLPLGRRALSRARLAPPARRQPRGGGRGSRPRCQGGGSRRKPPCRMVGSAHSPAFTDDGLASRLRRRTTDDGRRVLSGSPTADIRRRTPSGTRTRRSDLSNAWYQPYGQQEVRADSTPWADVSTFVRLARAHAAALTWARNPYGRRRSLDVRPPKLLEVTNVGPKSVADLRLAMAERRTDEPLSCLVACRPLSGRDQAIVQMRQAGENLSAIARRLRHLSEPCRPGPRSGGN